jgi:hypothetical protein
MGLNRVGETAGKVNRVTYISVCICILPLWPDFCKPIMSHSSCFFSMGGNLLRCASFYSKIRLSYQLICLILLESDNISSKPWQYIILLVGGYIVHVHAYIYYL